MKSAESLLKTGKDSVFKEKDITTKDENGVEKTTKGYDTDAIYKAVSAFADDYNSVLSAAAKSKNSSVVSTASNMVQQTVANEKMLSRIGITIGEDNKLSVDEKKLKAADMTTVKSMMNGNGSFAYGVQTKASFISMYAKNDQNKASGVYGSSATYTASLFSNGDIWNSFILKKSKKIKKLKLGIDRSPKRRYNTSCAQEWRNWQTRRLQVPVVAISCGFKSHLLH